MHKHIYIVHKIFVFLSFQPVYQRFCDDLRIVMTALLLPFIILKDVLSVYFCSDNQLLLQWILFAFD